MPPFFLYSIIHKIGLLIMINISDVSFQYRNVTKPILDGFSLHIAKGEFVGIIGPTGCGKSTICYLLNGLIPHLIKGTFQGSVLVNGVNTVSSTVGEMSQFVGYMLQEPSFQIATPHVRSEIAFGMENVGVPRNEMEKRLETVLELLNIKHLEHKTTSELSEGEKQRIILASILTLNPEILVLDECSSMLDITSKTNLALTLKELNSKKGKTIIMVEHDLDYLLALTERIILIDKGEIVADGPTGEILTNVDLLTKHNLKPPELVELFHELQKEGLPIDVIPSNYQIAEKKLRSWLK
jgi:energy-coupling factor transport system ATP-binding protein